MTSSIMIRRASYPCTRSGWTPKPVRATTTMKTSKARSFVVEPGAPVAIATPRTAILAVDVPDEKAAERHEPECSRKPAMKARPACIAAAYPGGGVFSTVSPMPYRFSIQPTDFVKPFRRNRCFRRQPGPSRKIKTAKTAIRSKSGEFLRDPNFQVTDGSGSRFGRMAEFTAASRSRGRSHAARPRRRRRGRASESCRA